jgi:hypothetical protein
MSSFKSPNSNGGSSIFSRLKNKYLTLNNKKQTLDIIADNNLEKELETFHNMNQMMSNSNETFLTEAPIENDTGYEQSSNGAINRLPFELICKIFEFMSVNQAKQASALCKKWRYAFFESVKMNQTIFKANNTLFVSERPLIQSKPLMLYTAASQHRPSSSMALVSNFNLNLYQNLINLEFECDSADINLLLAQRNISSSSDHAAFLLPNLRYLKINKTNLSAKTLIDLLNQAPKLKSLHLIQCDSLFMSGFLAYNNNTSVFSDLKCLEELSLSRNRYLSDFLLNLFMQNCDKLNLKRLDLSYCYLTKSNFKSVPYSLSLMTTTNNNVLLTIENLIRIFDGHSGLRSVNLSGIDIFNNDESSLLNLIEKLKNLSELEMSNLPSLKVESLNKILLAKNLTIIDLSNSVQVDDSRQPSFETCLNDNNIQNLKVLKLGKARINDPDLFVNNLSLMSGLTHLDLSCAQFQKSFINMNRLSAFIESFARNLSLSAPNLEILLLSYCDFLVNDHFIQLAIDTTSGLRKLKHLDLRNCAQLTDASMHSICKHLVNLEHLDLSWCQLITDFGLYNQNISSEQKQLLSSENQKSFDYLSVKLCRCMKKYIEQPFMLLKIKTELENDNGLSSFCTCKDRYTSLNDMAMRKVGHSSEILSFKSLKRLKILKLESCVNLTDSGLFYGLNLEQIEELDIKLCTSINGDFVNSVLGDQEKAAKEKETDRQQKEFKLSNFKSLNLNQCTKFKEENLMFIIRNAPNLRHLNLSNSPTITNRLIDLLLNRKKILIECDFSFCSSLSESHAEKYEQFLFNEFGSREFRLDKRFLSK